MTMQIGICLHRRVRIAECDGSVRASPPLAAWFGLSIRRKGHLTIHAAAIARCMHNVELIAESMRSGAALSAISAEQRLSYVPLTYPPKLPPAPSRWRALVDGSALRRSGRCRARYGAIRSALIQALASCATAVLTGAAVAAPVPLALTEAQQLAIEHSRQTAAYDSAIAAARDMAVAAVQSPEK